MDKHYFHKDHLGSSTAVSSASGVTVEASEYMPFGPMREHTGSVISNYKYTDQELDPERGLYFYDARYYDPIIGRFISPDTIVQNYANPQSLNRYDRRQIPVDFFKTNTESGTAKRVIGKKSRSVDRWEATPHFP